MKTTPLRWFLLYEKNDDIYLLSKVYDLSESKTIAG